MIYSYYIHYAQIRIIYRKSRYTLSNISLAQDFFYPILNRKQNRTLKLRTSKLSLVIDNFTTRRAGLRFNQPITRFQYNEYVLTIKSGLPSIDAPPPQDPRKL